MLEKFKLSPETAKITSEKISLLGEANLEIDLDRILNEYKTISDKLELVANDFLDTELRQVNMVLRQNEQKRNDAYSRVMGRIKTQTSILSEYDEFGLLDLFIKNLSEEEFHWNGKQKKIKFDTQKDLTKVHPRAVASYNIYSGIVSVGEKYKNIVDKVYILNQLVKNGVIEDAENIIHEIIHSYKFSNKFPKRLRIFIKDIWEFFHDKGRKVELHETHAYYSKIQKRVSSLDKRMRSCSGLIKHLEAEYKNKITNINIDKIIFSFQAIGYLKALGYSDKEIGELIV